MLVGLTLYFPKSALGATLFFEDFEADLSAWYGKNGGSHNGVIVNDPLSSDYALTFSALDAGGDIFTQDIFPTGNYILSFDYLGTCGDDDCGGFIGINYAVPGSGGLWLAGTTVGSGVNPYPDILPDTGQWEHMSIAFSASQNFHLMLEDFSGSGGTYGDVYFDNILLADASPIPEPSTIFLLASGLIGLVAYRKRLQLFV